MPYIHIYNWSIGVNDSFYQHQESGEGLQSMLTQSRELQSRDLNFWGWYSYMGWQQHRTAVLHWISKMRTFASGTALHWYRYTAPKAHGVFFCSQIVFLHPVNSTCSSVSCTAAVVEGNVYTTPLHECSTACMLY